MPYYTIKKCFFPWDGISFFTSNRSRGQRRFQTTHHCQRTQLLETLKRFTFFSEYEIRKEQIAGKGVQFKHGCTNQNRNPQDMLKEQTCQKIKGCNEQNLRNLCQCNRFILLNLHGPKHVLKAVFSTNMAKKLLFS